MARAVQADECKQSFFYFMQTFWGVIIPETPVFNWHIEYLCNELQKLSYYIVNRLPKPYDVIINIPPGSTKTTLVTIMWPAWLWTQDQTIRIISNSYSGDLSLEHASKSKDIITSDLYRELFPEIMIRRDKSGKGSYENTKKGARYSTSTGGTITGKHAHVIINDDPVNPKQAESDPLRLQANEHTKTLSSRKVDKKNTPMVTIMQRLHDDDVTGYLLKKKGDKGEYLLAKYLLYMKANLESVSLASLAREFYVSEGYLSRYFHRETGSTFSHLLMEMKMKRAAELLLKTECSIEKIVALIGYTDQSNFFRNFKAIYGMTPLVYRKKQGQADFMRVL